MFIQISICLLYYCIYTAKIVNKLRIHQFYSLNPQKYISSIHSPLKNTQKHQVYTLARRFFHSFFPSERWFAYLRKDQSGLPWCQKPLYFLTFSTPLLRHQGYTLNMARGNEIDSHFPCLFSKTAVRNISTVFWTLGVRGNISSRTQTPHYVWS